MKTLSCNLFTNIFKSFLSETGHLLSHKMGDLIHETKHMRGSYRSGCRRSFMNRKVRDLIPDSPDLHIKVSLLQKNRYRDTETPKVSSDLWICVCVCDNEALKVLGVISKTRQSAI